MSFKFADYHYEDQSYDEFADLRSARRKSATHSFIVISTYYKHAECSFSYLYGDDDLRDFLIHELIDYYKRVDDGNPLPKLSVEQMNQLDLDTLCSHAVIQGKYRIENEIQWGIRAIIRVQGHPQTIVDDRTADEDQERIRKGHCKRKRDDLE